MRPLIASCKIFLVVLYTFITYTIYMAGYVLVKLFRISSEPWRNLFMRTWSFGMSKILNLHIKTVGTPPKAPFFLVSNHLSYVDIVPLFLNLKCTFVAKKEVRSWPVLGFMVNSVGVIFIDRTRKRDITRVNTILSNSLNKHQGMIVFPEGTTSAGTRILPFRASLLQFPASMNIPVHYCSIRYETNQKKRDEHAEKSVCFYGAREPIHLHLFKLASNKRIDCTIQFGDKPVKNNDRKELTDELHEKIEEIFVPMD
ncbi:MAG: lysophospholipid acyltransferase family protein [Balneolaceae bacterium]